MTPLISVIIPTYNRRHYLAEAIDSALAQEFDRFEVIVVDDGSTDGTWALLESYGPRIHRLRQENQGVAAATMRGVRLAAAPLIALHDSDDRMLPGRLGAQHALLEQHPEVAAVTGNAIFEGSEKTNYLESLGIDFGGRDYVIFDRPYERLVAKNFMANSASCFRRDHFLQGGGYDLSYRAVQDSEFWLRMAREWTLACLNRPCTWVRSHPGSLSRSAAALECKVRLYERELDSGDLTNPELRKQIARRLMHLTRSYARTSLETSDRAQWRAIVRRASRHLPYSSRCFLDLATRLPRPLAQWLC